MYFYRCKTFARSTAEGSRFSATGCVRITRTNVTDLYDLNVPHRSKIREATAAAVIIILLGNEMMRCIFACII